jgi:thymidylate synthase (FAD)
MKISKTKVTLLDSMGTDLSVVNAARVSFDKESEYIQTPVGEDIILSLPEKDIKLISYLAKNNHWTPFGHCFVSFRIKAPIFIARQLVKHQVGLCWNEVSRRYVDSEPEFYLPDEWRCRAENVKQGSSTETVDLGFDFNFDNSLRALITYEKLLEHGVCPEQARMVLPLNTMTEWIWSGSLAAFSRVCKLRLDSHTQKETQEVALQIDKIMLQLFPVSWHFLMEKSNG